MRIEIRGRNVEVTEEIREHVRHRFERVSRQVSELATLEVELCEERNPAIPDSQEARATLRLKGVTLRARESSPDMMSSVNAAGEDMVRQVKKHREKRRNRRRTREQVNRANRRTQPGIA